MRIQLDVLVPATFCYDVETNSLEEALKIIKNNEIKPVDKVYDEPSMEIEGGFLITDNGGTQTEINIS